MGNEKDNTLTVISDLNMNHRKVLLVNINDTKEEDFETTGGKIFTKIEENIGTQKNSIIEIMFPPIYKNINNNVCKIASGILLKSWNFNKYKSQKKENNLKINIVSNEIEKSKEDFEYFKSIFDGTSLAKEIISEPSNVMYP